jgi:UDP-2,3-diacylglucosamine pyrophosphatase LpxH
MNNLTALFLGASLLACPASNPPKPAEAGPSMAAVPPGPTPTVSTPTVSRRYVLISDLHFGPGHSAGNAWDPIEDFRWPGALRGFLSYIATWGSDKVDLVILGDFFELWQHPAQRCLNADPDLGCTPSEMAKIVQRVLDQHHAEMDALWAFAERGQNRLIVVPGNHDAALLTDSIWKQVLKSAGHPSARVRRSADGYWSSEDGFIFAEHGHQIGFDVSGYGNQWPGGFGKAATSSPYPRPWGQIFVESFFDTAEVTYPIIDNIIPQSKGVGLLLSGQTVAADAAQVARFLAFNVVRTSLKQKVMLNIPTPENQRALLTETHGWDIDKGRGLGVALFADSLPSGDWWRESLLTGQGPYWDGVRTELKRLAADPDKLSLAEVVTLCDRIAVLAKEEEGTKRETCSSQLALSAMSSLVPEATILASHLNKIRSKYEKAGIFIYGHTHEMAPKFEIKLKDGSVIDVLNTGAFQRLTDLAGLTALQTDRKLSPLEALKLSPDDLKPCYSAVLVEYRGRDPEPMLRYWYMPEDAAEGNLLEPCDAKCPRIARSCGE